MIVFILSLSACSGEVSSSSSPDNNLSSSDLSSSDSPNSEEIFPVEITSYMTGYKEYRRISEAFADKVNGIIDSNNFKLEEMYPSDFYKRDGYANFVLPLPFVCADIAFTSSFNEETSKQNIEESLSAFFDECTFTRQKEDSYRLDYTIKNEELSTSYNGYFTAEYDMWTGAIRFTSYSDKDGSMRMTSFLEFVTVDDDKYAICDTDEQAIITYKNGAVIEFMYSKNKIGYSEVNDTSWYNEPEIYSGDREINEQWIDKDAEQLQCVIKFKDNNMTIDERTCSIKYGRNNRIDSVKWNWEDKIKISA